MALFQQKEFREDKKIYLKSFLFIFFKKLFEYVKQDLDCKEPYSNCDLDKTKRFSHINLSANIVQLGFISRFIS